MIITEQTTVEEYEAWLATNPKMSLLRVAVRSTVKSIFRTISRVSRRFTKIGRLLRGKNKHRACTSSKLVKHTIYPFSYDKNGAYKVEKFQQWVKFIRHELALTTAYIEIIESIDSIDDLNTMDQLKIEALKIINQ